MSVILRHPISPIDVSVISASIDGGYTSEEALYSIDSKRLKEFTSTIKSVKFNDIVEEHEHGDTLVPKREQEQGPTELLEVFCNREMSPSPDTPGSENYGYSDNDERPLQEEELEVFKALHSKAKVHDISYILPNMEHMASAERIENLNDNTSFSDVDEIRLHKIPSEDNSHLFEFTNKEKNDALKVLNIENDGVQNGRSISSDRYLTFPKTTNLDTVTDSGSGSSSGSNGVFTNLQKPSAQKVVSTKALIEKFEKKVITLQTCNEVQKEIIDKYKNSNNELQREVNVIKFSYDKLISNNLKLCEKVKILTDDLEKTKIELDVISKIKEVEQIYQPPQINSAVISSEQSFEKVREMIKVIQLKNEFLHQALMFVTERVNNIYRYTISPALFLFNEEPDSVNSLPTFDSGYSVQEFIDSNVGLFRQVDDINQIVDVSNEKVFEQQKQKILQDLSDYFDELNENVASKLENTVCSNVRSTC